MPNLNWLVSVDDHILEPGHLWLDRLPTEYHTDDEKYQILRGNAEQLFQFTPADPPTELPGVLADLAGVSS